MTTYTGRVYDIDWNFNPGWTQVLVENGPGGLFAHDARLGGMLTAAWKAGAEVTLQTGGSLDQDILSAEADIPSYLGPHAAGEWEVTRLAYDAVTHTLSATFRDGGGAEAAGIDRIGLADGVIAGGIHRNWPLTYLDIDPTYGWIKRVKVNGL